MAPHHAFTIQLADRDLLGKQSPGHAATVISTPWQQIYAGLGPAYHDWRHFFGAYSPPSFSPQVVSREETPPHANYSTVTSPSPYATYTIPIAENQTQQGIAEIRRRAASDEWYDARPTVRNYCTTDVNRNAMAMELGAMLPYEAPGANRDYLANIERTLRANPRAKFIVDEQGRLMLDSVGRPTAIPDSLREIQQDYAFVGGGYDTPSERLGHVPSSSGPPNPHKWRSGDSPLEFVEANEGNSATAKAVRTLSRQTGYQLRAPEEDHPQGRDLPVSFDERSGNWTVASSGVSPRNPNLPPPQSSRSPGLVSGKPMPLWVTPPPIWGDLGNPAPPAKSDLPDRTIDDWLLGLLRRRDVR